MKSRLDSITNWDERLRGARWQAEALARGCGMGVWELRHYILQRFGLHLHDWIRSRRVAQARLLLRRGVPVKEVSWALGYKRASHFSREFKRVCGISPSDSRFTEDASDPSI